MSIGARGRQDTRPNDGLDRPGQSGLGRKNVEIILDIEDGNWNFTTQPGALRRVIMNLFGNAVKYTMEGSITVHIGMEELGSSQVSEEAVETRVPNSGKMLVLTISDTGKVSLDV